MDNHEEEKSPAGAQSNLSGKLAAIVIAERDNYAALIAHGKGEWPHNGYVRDETWAGWKHTLFVLNSILREAANVLGEALPTDELEKRL